MESMQILIYHCLRCHAIKYGKTVLQVFVHVIKSIIKFGD